MSIFLFYMQKILKYIVLAAVIFITFYFYTSQSKYKQQILYNKRGFCGVSISNQGNAPIHLSYGSANFMISDFDASEDEATSKIFNHSYLISIENLSNCDLPGYMINNSHVLDDYAERIRNSSRILNLTDHEAIKNSDIYPFDLEYFIGKFREESKAGFWRSTRILQSKPSKNHPPLLAICEYGSSIKSNRCDISISPACFPELIFTINGMQLEYLQQSGKIRDALDKIASQYLDHQGLACP